MIETVRYSFYEERIENNLMVYVYAIKDVEAGIEEEL
jgi:hypothetical protein